jgi:adenylosuccinate synthase
VAYKTPDGRELKSSMPADVETVEQVEPVYETLPGWRSDISNVRTWNDLPKAARDYVQRCEDLVGVPVKWIGVGPGRDAIVVKP